MSNIQTNSHSGVSWFYFPAQLVRAKEFKIGNSFVVTETKNGVSYVRGSGKGAVKLQRSGEKGPYYLTIPKKIMKRHGWAKGDFFVLSDIRNGIRFTRGEIR
ncbi:hypothetical protein FXW07_07160 [Methanosarcina sp. DH1]|uniref:hypothetical protein n=1 Tax=Methanosarcina sp. DH1 TaxID=2605695 RepID=UPI001E545807|nr:hypothetical protein [Methanosarcina sp. DH1]MCC4766398.1 hypothetical protein [Methanosarcina sp. DH1]